MDAVSAILLGLLMVGVIAALIAADEIDDDLEREKEKQEWRWR